MSLHVAAGLSHLRCSILRAPRDSVVHHEALKAKAEDVIHHPEKIAALPVTGCLANVMARDMDSL